MLLQFKKSKESKASCKRSIVLAGDIGATKTNLALFKGWHTLAHTENMNKMPMKKTFTKSQKN